MSKFKKGTLLMAVGLALVLAALALTGYNIYDGKRAEKKSAEILTLLEDAEVNGISDNKELFEKYPNMSMPTKEVDGLSIIGVIEIPSLDIALPVCKDWSYENLESAPCRYSGSIYSHDCVIAAHNYSRHFAGLKNLEKGSSVVFTDVAGNVFNYVTDSIGALDSYAVEEMKSTGYDLTLFTCNQSGSARVTVGCRLVQ
ncbi:MAG: sortase [Clostridiales bacterium]|nr:sortase [Clostridiales bacterium]